MSPSAPLAEIFSSFQGEGIYVGVRQIFVRLRGCELTCKYCDTPEARSTEGPCRIERHPGSNDWEQITNPVTVDTAAAVVTQLASTTLHHSVSLTGGEPLLQPDFVRELLSCLKADGLGMYLDTACCYPQAMADIAPLVDIVAADYKLPQTMVRPIDFEDFAATWQAIRGERFIKIVLTDEVRADDLAQHCRRIAALDAKAQIVLQPATAIGGVRPPGQETLFALATVAARHFPTGRLIPQCHRLLGVK